MRSIGKGIFNGERRGKERERNGEDTACLEFHSRPGKIKREKEKKKMRGRVKKKGEGKHDFPNISSKCEVYCEKKNIRF